MMEIGTWLAVFFLGPGAIAVFVWFLVDILRSPLARNSTGRRRAGRSAKKRKGGHA